MPDLQALEERWSYDDAVEAHGILDAIEDSVMASRKRYEREMRAASRGGR